MKKSTLSLLVALLAGFTSYAFGQACDITLETQVIASGNATGEGSGIQSGTWFALSPMSVAVVEAGMERIAKSVDKGNKGGNHRVIMTGRKTCAEGVTHYTPVDVKAVSLHDINQIMRAQSKESDELMKLGEKSEKDGKKTAWQSKDK